jgi:hypothetical protein
MYEEQYEGGKFYARILNEFYGDIEELFLDPQFSKIEKNQNDWCNIYGCIRFTNRFG